jgi:hypothetical protein
MNECGTCAFGQTDYICAHRSLSHVRGIIRNDTRNEYMCTE